MGVEAEHRGPPAALGFRARVGEARGRLGGAQKSMVGVPAYLRFVNRRIGRWLAALGYGARLTPNHLTALSAAFSLAGITAIAAVEPSVPMAVLVTAALLVGYAFDSADGQLSRVRGDGKRSGEWLDHVVDMAKTASLHAAVLISLFRFSGFRTRGWFLVPLAFGIVNITFFFAMMLRDQLGARPARTPGSSPGGTGSPARSLLLLPMDYGTLCVVFLLLASPTGFLVAYTALFVIMTAFATQSFVKAYRSLAQPG